MILTCIAWTVAPAVAWEYGVLSDFHFSVREELSGDRESLVDNELSLDADGIGDVLGFHSQFLVTSDFNFTGSEEVQLTLAYLTADRLLGHWDVSAGRQFFSQGFDAFIGDGIRLQYRYADAFRCAVHLEAPFDAESATLKSEPILVYGTTFDAQVLGRATPVPLHVAVQVERRDFLQGDAPDQTLLGTELLAEASYGLDADLYADVEYEAESSRLRRVRVGSRLYPTPLLSCTLEVERFEPDLSILPPDEDDLFRDSIAGWFARSTILGGSLAVDYILPCNRAVGLGYSVNRYRRGGDAETFGHTVDAYLTLLSVPERQAVITCGYSGILVPDAFVHEGVLRAGVAPFPDAYVSLTGESGVLNTRDWSNEWILHLRAAFRYTLLSWLEASVIVEENRNPYFDSDFRALVFARLLLGSARVLQ